MLIGMMILCTRMTVFCKETQPDIINFNQVYYLQQNLTFQTGKAPSTVVDRPDSFLTKCFEFIGPGMIFSAGDHTDQCFLSFETK